MTTLEDEIDRKWPLSDVPFIGVEESQCRRTEYEAARERYRLLHPVTPREEC